LILNGFAGVDGVSGVLGVTRLSNVSKVSGRVLREFERWLKERYRSSYRRVVLQYVKRFGDDFLRGDLSRVVALSGKARMHVLDALACFSKYLGRYDYYAMLKKRYGLRYEHRDSHLIIDRMDATGVAEWFMKAKTVLGDYNIFLDFLAYTGLRVEEALQSWKLIHSEDGYYDHARMVLQHYKHPDMFLRRTKKAYISFAPKHIVEKLRSIQAPSYQYLRHKLKKKKLPTRFSDLRELWASIMSRHLQQHEIDFIQGRIGNVFLKHYYNPKYVEDLKERIEKGWKEIENLLRITLTGVADVKI